MPQKFVIALLGAAYCLLTSCSAGSDSQPLPGASAKVAMVNTSPGATPKVAWEQPVPKAVCGVNDLPETGLQGQVPQIDRLSGRSMEGYRCNLELVGQYAGEGASWQMAWFDDCAYFDTAKTIGINTNGSTSRPDQQHPGVVVIDASDSAHPQATGFLDTEAMLDPWESLKVHQKRGLLAAVDGAGSGGSAFFDIYDLKQDCRHPKLLSSKKVGIAVGHAGEFSTDGLTFYGTDTNAGIRAIDLAQPDNPLLVAEGFPRTTHDISTSADGMRTYQAVVGLGAGADNGLSIVDVSDIQNRKPDPKLSVISDFYWEDGAAAQMTQEFKIGGHLYLLFTDEGVSSATKGTFCQQGLPPFGFARILDLADLTKPKVVAKLMLEIHDPDNCAMTVSDGTNLFGYDSHYCTVDNIEEATMVACGHIESGLRIFDIRDPYLPRELAYYNPPAKPGYQAGSNFNSAGTCSTVDWSTSRPRFRLDRNEIWFTSQCNGFQIVKFTKPLAELLGAGPAVVPGTSTAITAQRGKFGGAFGLALLLPLLASALRRQHRVRRLTP